MAVVPRVFEWFWQSAAERAVRADSGTPSPRALELISRASLANEAATRTERPPEPFTQAGSEAIAAELYRESIHWALLAEVELRSPPAVSGASAPGTQPLPALLELVDKALLVRAAGGESELSALTPELTRSYREFAELEPSAQRKLVERLGRLSQGLVDQLGSVAKRLERIWVRRVLHIALSLVVAIGAVSAARQLLRLRERGRDLAAHASWTLSSRYPQGGCESPRQDCPGGENYFFHTNQEQDPAVIFDLGKERRISAVEVDNRLDCCSERAVPLAIDVSTNKTKWTEVARHNTEFTNMRESFSSVRARYVKIHIPRPNAILHLSKVRIYP